MIEPKTYIAYAPRGPGVMCALFYVLDGDDVFGWYTGASGAEFASSYFMLDGYYARREITFFRSREDDVYGVWLQYIKGKEVPIDPPVPVPESLRHELERIQDVFVREWLFHADSPGTQVDASIYRARDLPVQPVNVRARKLNKLHTGHPVWTHASPDCDKSIVGYLGRHWALEYRPDD